MHEVIRLYNHGRCDGISVPCKPSVRLIKNDMYVRWSFIDLGFQLRKKDRYHQCLLYMSFFSLCTVEVFQTFWEPAFSRLDFVLVNHSTHLKLNYQLVLHPVNKILRSVRHRLISKSVTLEAPARLYSTYTQKLKTKCSISLMYSTALPFWNLYASYTGEGTNKYHKMPG